MRATAQAWFVAEYDSIWAPAPVAAAPATATAAAARPSHPQYSGASFLDFMEGLTHVNGEVEQDEDEEVEDVVSEAARYLKEPVVHMATDILVWWAAQEGEYPNLSRMARQYLGCPATSASAERLFSIAGRVFDDHGQKIDASVLEERMWARINSEGRK